MGPTKMQGKRKCDVDNEKRAKKAKVFAVATRRDCARLSRCYGASFVLAKLYRMGDKCMTTSMLLRAANEVEAEEYFEVLKRCGLPTDGDRSYSINLETGEITEDMAGPSLGI